MEKHQLPSTNPPETKSCLLSYPAPWVLLVTINREAQMNSIPYGGHWEMDALFTWFDEEPNLRVAIITGVGTRSFSAGLDLIELGNIEHSRPPPWTIQLPASGFAGLSRRKGKKPVIAAVNGYALGGGFETSLNW
jgi:enoyl-CoA hydratase/carnithine racemase